MANVPLKSIKFPGLSDTYTVPQIDSTLTAEGKAADAKAVGDKLTDLKSAVDNTDAIIDEITDPVITEMTGTKTTNKFINYNKVISDANSNFYIYTYDVTAGDDLLLSGTAPNSGYFYLITDASDNILGNSEQNTSGGFKSYTDVEAVVPTGATKLIVASNIGSSSYVAAIAKKITGYSVNGMSDLDSRIDALEDNYTDVTEIASASSSEWTVHDNHYMFATGSESSEATGWQYFEYPVPENATALIVTASAGQAAPLWVLKNASGTVLDYSEDTSAVAVKTDLIDLSGYTGVAKLFVNDKKSGSIAIQYKFITKKVDGESVSVNGISLSDAIDNTNPLMGKILVCAGDSITYGADMDSDGITNDSNITVYQSDGSGNFTQTQTGFRKTWNYQIASRNNMTLYNAGVSGSTIQALSDHAGFSIENGRYTKLPDSIDYLLIWFGWNDNAYGTLGAITDTANTSYYGAFNVVLPYLINKYPYAKIGLIVPFGTTAGHREAIRLLGNKWGLAVWDNYQGGTPLYFGKETSVGVEESIVTANKAKFQANGAHPNYKGHTQLADMIEAWLKGI